MLPTGSGDDVADRRAAAAAADERPLLVDGRFRKAWLAARAALLVVVGLRGMLWALARLALLPRRRENMPGMSTEGRGVSIGRE